MTKKAFLWGMLALALAFGMMVAGCGPREENPEDDDDGIRYFGGWVALDNYYPVVGETITASFREDEDDPPIGTPSWRWYKSESQYGEGSSIGYSNTYTVRQSDEGFWIYAEISYSGNTNTQTGRTNSAVIGIPATANVSISIEAVYYPSRSYTNHYVTVTLTLSAGRWNDDISYDTASEWITMFGTPSVSSWYTEWYHPLVSVKEGGKKLEFSYSTASDTVLSISNLTATLNTAQLSTMRSNTNVYNTLMAGASTTDSVSQWTISEY